MLCFHMEDMVVDPLKLPRCSKASIGMYDRGKAHLQHLYLSMDMGYPKACVKEAMFPRREETFPSRRVEV